MQVNKSITVVSGTPINLASGKAAGFGYPVYARSVSVQMKSGGSGLGYIMCGVAPGRVPAATNACDLTQQIYPASDTTPGGIFSNSNEAGDIDVNSYWLDGSHSGDVILASYDEMV